MKQKIIKALQKMNLNDSNKVLSWDSQKEANFGLVGHGKEAVGELFVGENNTVFAKIYLTNYSERYFKAKLAKHFRDENITNYEISFLDRWPESGDIVNTQFNEGNFDEGDRVELSSRVKFYSYQDLPVSCNGFELGKDFDAIFEGYFDAVCVGSPYGPDTYSKFRLL